MLRHDKEGKVNSFRKSKLRSSRVGFQFSVE